MEVPKAEVKSEVVLRIESFAKDNFRKKYALTRRQAEVLWLSITGLPDKAIALKLNIGFQTVAEYKGDLFIKTNTHSVPGLSFLFFNIFYASIAERGFISEPQSKDLGISLVAPPIEDGQQGKPQLHVVSVSKRAAA